MFLTNLRVRRFITSCGKLQQIEFISLNEVIPLCIYIFTLLLYIAVNTTIIECNTNATCFDLQ